MRIKGFPDFYRTKVTPTSYHNLHLTLERVSLKTSQKGFLEVHHLAKLPMFTLTWRECYKCWREKLKMLLSICPITEGDSSPSVLSDSRSKSNSETNQLGILRWSVARCMIAFKHSFTWPHWISWGSWGGQGQGAWLCSSVPFSHDHTALFSHWRLLT